MVRSWASLASSLQPLHVRECGGLQNFFYFFETLLCHFEPEANSLGWKSCYTSGYVLGSGLSNPTFQVRTARERDRLWSRGGYILRIRGRTVGWEVGEANPE